MRQLRHYGMNGKLRSTRFRSICWKVSLNATIVCIIFNFPFAIKLCDRSQEVTARQNNARSPLILVFQRFELKSNATV